MDQFSAVLTKWKNTIQINLRHYLKCRESIRKRYNLFIFYFLLAEAWQSDTKQTPIERQSADLVRAWLLRHCCREAEPGARKASVLIDMTNRCKVRLTKFPQKALPAWMIIKLMVLRPSRFLVGLIFGGQAFLSHRSDWITLIRKTICLSLTFCNPRKVKILLLDISVNTCKSNL